MLKACPVCGSGDRVDVLSLAAMPALINAQVLPEHAVDVPRGDIDLVVCEGCSHLYNRSFDANVLDYDASYENTLHYSPVFVEFAEQLADRLVADHRLDGAVVAELGSGPGHFLEMLCTRGVRRAAGFDPSFDPERVDAVTHPSVALSSEMFPTDGSVAASLAITQHVLEHLDDPVAALSSLRRSVEQAGGIVYTEVPNGSLMLERCALWDLVFEHLSYFVPASLRLAHRRAGLEPATTEAAFGDQFLWCEASPADRSDLATSDDVAVGVDAAVAFGRRARARIDEALEELASLIDAGPVVVWGAGSKGMTYLNVADQERLVSAVVDINPRKHGYGVPGTGTAIIGPDGLRSLRPRTVLVSNPVYRSEVEVMLRARDSDANVHVVWS